MSDLSIFTAHCMTVHIFLFVLACNVPNCAECTAEEKPKCIYCKAGFVVKDNRCQGIYIYCPYLHVEQY